MRDDGLQLEHDRADIDDGQVWKFADQPVDEVDLAGRTNCVISNISGNAYTLVPTQLVCAERQQVDLKSDLWKAVLDATGQLNSFNNDINLRQTP